MRYTVTGQMEVLPNGKRICTEWRVEGECWGIGLVSKTGKNLSAVVKEWEALFQEGETLRAEQTAPCPYGSDRPPAERDERDDYGFWRTGIVEKTGGVR